MKRIIFISHDPLTPSIINNYYLDSFIRDGIDIRYLCVRNLVSYAKNVRLSDEIVTDYYTEVCALQELEVLLNGMAVESWICLELWADWRTAPVYRLLKPFAASIFTINWYCNAPVIPLRKKLYDDLCNLSFSKLYQAAGRMLSRKVFDYFAKWNKINYLPLLFAPGEGILEKIKNRKVIAINHHDYEVFVTEANRANSSNINSPYAVFVDTMLPSHPDFKRVRSKTLQADTYYGALNDFFDHLEHEKGVKIIIAAHPKSDYKQEFGSRQVIKGQTNDLIKNCAFVIMHYSAAINFAVLNHKALLFIYTNDFDKAGADNYALQSIFYAILLYSNILNSTTVNINDDRDFELKPVDSVRYNQFIKKYIRGIYNADNYNVIKKELGL
jgi:hypothetical protein